MSLAESIFAEHRADKVPTEPITVFNRKLFIKRRTYAERIECDAKAIVKGTEDDKPEIDKKRWAAVTVISCLVDDKGQQVFSYDHIDDVLTLDEAEMEKAHQAATKYNMSAIEGAKKNSVNGQHSSLVSVLQES